MIGGWPWSAWALLLVGVGLPLAIEIAFVRNQLRRRRAEAARRAEGDGR